MPLPIIVHTEPILDRKSSFQAHAAVLTSVAQAHAVRHFLVTDKRLSKATHNVFAFRFFDPAKQALIADCDDDGEDAAGARVAHLLAVRHAHNVVVVVSRWFGGTQLGPVRFKHINTAARQALDLLPLSSSSSSSSS
ncbi:MAG: YigZ family protein [archaeon]|nr:YigZ family protein [archaeon]